MSSSNFKSGISSFVLLSIFVSALSLVGCQKSGDLLYLQRPIPDRVTNEKTRALNVKIATNPEVDVLWVIDNSYSMDPYQRAVINNTSSFIQAFTQNTALQWKMGLISTDETENPYVGFTAQTALDWKTVDPVQVFQKAVGQLGLNGSSEEKMFDPIMRAFRNTPDFVRPSAYLALIVVSDEEEQSSMAAQDFMDKMVALKGGITKKVLSYGVFQEYETCGNSYLKYAGSRYESWMNVSQGSVLYLCDPNFGQALAALGANLVSKIAVQKPTITLEARPKPGTLKISYLGAELPSGPASSGGIWIYDVQYNIIVFHNANFVTTTPDVQVTFEEDNGS